MNYIEGLLGVAHWVLPSRRHQAEDIIKGEIELLGLAGQSVRLC